MICPLKRPRWTSEEFSLHSLTVYFQTSNRWCHAPNLSYVLHFIMILCLILNTQWDIFVTKDKEVISIPINFFFLWFSKMTKVSKNIFRYLISCMNWYRLYRWICWRCDFFEIECHYPHHVIFVLDSINS